MNQYQLTMHGMIEACSARVGIIGLGYVGIPLMLAITAKRYRVLGFDVDESRVAELNADRSPLRHIASDRIAHARNEELFSATSDFDRLAEIDIIIICVPTPLGKHREPDLSPVRAVAASVAARLRKGQMILFESTSYPGTTVEIVRPLLERAGHVCGTDFFLAYSPEREDPGNTKFSTSQIPKVVGADDEPALMLASAFYATFVDRVVPLPSTRAAEAVKLTENVFRAVNIALANELKVIYSRMGIDIFEVIAAAKTKPFGYMAFYPGPGLGGHCIPVDPFYLAWKAREFKVSSRFIELAGEINAEMPRYVVNRVVEVLGSEQNLSLSSARILVVGIAYKRDVDDIRESPALAIIEMLQERGAIVDYHDPYIATIPATHDHPALAGMKSVSVDADNVAGYSLVLIVTDHSAVEWQALADAARLIIDTRNVAGRLCKDHCRIFPA